MQRFSVLYRCVCLVLASGLFVYAPAWAATLLVVDDDGVECPNADFTTIQAAVDAAAAEPGTQEIRVCKGMYAENVSIGLDNSVVIFGDGVGLTVVKGVAGTAGPIINAADAVQVDIRNLTVDGMSAMANVSVCNGIRYQQTSGTIQDVAVLNIRNASGSCQGIGIRAESTGQSINVQVQDTHVENFTRVGINGNGEGVKIKIVANDVVGPVDPKVWAPNGIQVARGASGTVKNNDISDAISPNPSGGAGSGIILFCAGKSTVTNNQISNSDLGIAIADNANAKVSNNDVDGSLFEAFSLQYIGTLFGDLGCPLFPSPTEKNKLINNKATASTENGVSLAGFDPMNASIPTTNIIKKTDIKDSGIDGIHVFSGEKNRFIKNDIGSSGNLDIVDDTIPTPNTWRKNACHTTSQEQNQLGLCDPSSSAAPVNNITVTPAASPPAQPF
jgi:parallel beta-helix repeat protein